MIPCALFDTLVLPVDDQIDAAAPTESLGVWRARFHLERCEPCRMGRDRLHSALMTFGPDSVDAKPLSPSLIRVTDLARIESVSAEGVVESTEPVPGSWSVTPWLVATVAALCVGLFVCAPELLDFGVISAVGRPPDQAWELELPLSTCFVLMLAPLASLGVLMPFFVSGLFCRNGQCLA